MTVKQEAIANSLDAANTEKAARHRLERSGYEVLKTIACRFRSGTMFLRGEVPTYYHKQLAQEAVRTLAAVNAINNQITVTPRRARLHLRANA